MSIEHQLKIREIAKQVKVYSVDRKCDNLTCDGIMRPTGLINLVHPKEYVHKCTNCNFKCAFIRTYPRMEYIEI